MEPSTASCTHFNGRVEPPRANQCEECGSTVNLRVCTSCGHVGCCESQLGHNTAHAKASGHPVIKSLPLEEAKFTWCYECHAYLR
ncbi:MAG TPA: UBP-type zinc finger domain-containing protein [Polyangia bacterium]|nr:UBP-type zinc finger domain-containing protein [Polyangia bacterium]